MASPKEFAAQYGTIAKQVGDRLKVDPQILLGQWGLETGWGKSVVPGTNNLGNIKDFTGGGVGAVDNMTGSNDQYRAFETPDAFADHYAGLIERKYPTAIGTGDNAMKFAQALKDGGYAEDPAYIRKMVNVTNTVRKTPGIMETLANIVVPTAQAGTLPAELPPLDMAKVKFLDSSGGSAPALPALDMSKVKFLNGDAAPPINSTHSDGRGDTVRLDYGNPPTTEQRVLASAPGRFMKGVKDPIDAGAQMLVHALPSGMVDTVNSGVQAVNDAPIIGPITKALGMTPATAQQVDAGLANDEQVYQAARKATGSDGMDLMRIGGNIAGTAPLAVAPAAGASLAARTATGALSGAGFGMLQPVTEGQYDEEKLKQAGTGAAVGGLAAPAMAAIARLVSPRASTNPEVQRLLSEGITPTPGQIAGGAAQRFEDKATSIPIFGDAVVAARQRGVTEFNRAALNRALAPLGKDLNSIGRGGIKEVGETISAAYDDLLPKLTFRADNTFADDLSTIMNMATELPEQQINQLQRIIRDKVVGKLTPQGVADGLNYKQIESELGRIANNYLSATDADQRTLGTAIAEIQNSLRNALTRSNPNMATELGRINEAYSIFTRLQRAAGGVGAEGGVFTPAQLQSAVRAGDSSMRKGRFARGEAVLQDLSEAGKNVMGGKVPDSGTAGRVWAGLGALASGAINPAIPGGLIAASAPYAPGVNRAVAAMMAKRPDAAQDLAAQIRTLPPGVLALFGLSPQ